LSIFVHQIAQNAPITQNFRLRRALDPHDADALARHIWVNAYVLTVGGLGAPKLAEARRFASRPVLHCIGSGDLGDVLVKILGNLLNR
jgi:hypothetical protein